MTKEHLEKALEELSLLIEEGEVSKKCLDKIQRAIIILKRSDELCVQKALHELEEMSSYDLSAYHRTQVWGIISSLESIKN